MPPKAAGINFDITGCKFVDVQNIFHKMEQRNLVAAYKFYCQKNLDDAHTALADTRATLEVLEAQLDRYADTLKNNVDYLAEFSRRILEVAQELGLRDAPPPGREEFPREERCLHGGALRRAGANRLQADGI